MSTAAEVLSRLQHLNAENKWYTNPYLTGATKNDEDMVWHEVRDDAGRTGWWGLVDDGWGDDGTTTLVQLREA